MHLEYRYNNGYDSVILVDDDGNVRSDWTVDIAVLHDFCDCTQDAGDWDDRGGCIERPAEYGDLLAVRSGYGLEVIDEKRWAQQVNLIAH
ncbi:MAG: hypothetical protein KGL39_26235 [Patescibacteria group bacterium]|nr:hypothetical protein [Patescibacteria group bacterium]